MEHLKKKDLEMVSSMGSAQSGSSTDLGAASCEGEVQIVRIKREQ